MSWSHYLVILCNQEVYGW
ncbi:hypothetical protein NY801_001685 [Escherichia coli]|nr:hypothetical protein [Escherichia coli]